MSESRKIEFKLTFSPKASWVDAIYLGNLLTEMLGSWREKSQVFDFELTVISAPEENQ
ncbi:MAG: hypothetical protein HYU39_09365 [Thaumarchaeota archaeon]|nr:hypothetical protein [Nitrososphaerota archaeon]